MDSTRNTTTHEEARERIRHELAERLRRRRMNSPSRPVPSRPVPPHPVPPHPVPSRPVSPHPVPSRPVPPRPVPPRPVPSRSIPLVKKALRAEAEEHAREARWAEWDSSAPQAPEAPQAPSGSSEEGWDQGDGRWAGQVVVYDGNLPPTVRARLVPVKETHFRFRRPSDEEAFLSALSMPPQQIATYQSTGKKDVTLTSADGRLLGNIHFLHMDGPDIHRPEKYYMKLYLFNFTDATLLRNTKQRILEFVRTAFSSTSSPPGHISPIRPRIRTRRSTRPSRPSRPSRKRESRRSSRLHKRGRT